MAELDAPSLPQAHPLTGLLQVAAPPHARATWSAYGTRAPLLVPEGSQAAGACPLAPKPLDCAEQGTIRAMDRSPSPPWSSGTGRIHPSPTALVPIPFPQPFLHRPRPSSTSSRHGRQPCRFPDVSKSHRI